MKNIWWFFPVFIFLIREAKGRRWGFLAGRGLRGLERGGGVSLNITAAEPVAMRR